MRKGKTLDCKQLFEMFGKIASRRQPDDADAILYEILSTLGISVGVDRTYLFDFQSLENGNLIANQRAEWVDVGQSRQIANPNLQNIDLAENGFSDWNHKLRNGESITGLVEKLPHEQFDFLGKMQGIISIALVPVFSFGKLVGAMGYDDCTTERVWQKDEIEALSLAASIVGVLCYSTKTAST
ncbi:GAF domain-containing protein [Pontiellaceae bacterium B1224]|nr:GAF domain-containing protein [Pontiellaceae bacterium B1224]